MTLPIRIAIAILLAAAAATHAAETAPSCDTHAPAAGDRREVTCVLSPAAEVQRLRFRASFLGSHDDTTLALSATLEGQAVACDPGSKTSSRFEDGEITLECRFTVEPGKTRQLLRVALEWHHAQYADFTLSRQ